MRSRAVAPCAVMLVALVAAGCGPTRAPAGDPETGADAPASDVAVCTAGEVRCDGTTRYTCGPGGERRDALDCAQSSGVCAPRLGCVRCVPGERRCSPSVPEAVEVCAE